MNIERELNSITKEMTNLFKKEIERQGLVDSGDLLKSVTFTVNKNGGEYSIQMISLDYFKYLDKQYGITDKVFSSSQYKRLEEQLSDILTQHMLDQLIIPKRA